MKTQQNPEFKLSPHRQVIVDKKLKEIRNTFFIMHIGMALIMISYLYVSLRFMRIL